MANGYFTFIKELTRSFSEIGAMLPSSAALGRKMVQPVRYEGQGRSILEVGPGTGPFTRQVLNLMRDGDELIVCEINEAFLNLLRDSLVGKPDFERHRDRMSFYRGSVETLPEKYPGKKFDIIVSSVPFTCFTPQLVDGIFQTYHNILKPDGRLTFVEYAGFRKLREIFSKDEDKERVRAVDAVISKWCEGRGNGTIQDVSIQKRFTMMNVPPAVTIEVAGLGSV